jgi:hypothetical protein
MNKKLNGVFHRVWLSVGMALGAGLLALVMGCVNERVTRSAYEQIHEGMPMEEVEGILGKPSRQHHHDFYYEGQYGTIKIEAKKDSVHEIKWQDKH